MLLNTMLLNTMLHNVAPYQCSAPYAESDNDAYMMITIVC